MSSTFQTQPKIKGIQYVSLNWTHQENEVDHEDRAFCIFLIDFIEKD